jgi:twitching motility two-component system response regulator PilH
MADLSDCTILLVEDDVWMAEQTVHNLESALGCTVYTASNGIEAMDEIDARTPDVIVLDIFMPGPNGLVLLHELQSHTDLAKIPVIVCSNSVADLPSKELTHYGVVNVLNKTTMHPEDLVAAVKKVLL